MLNIKSRKKLMIPVAVVLLLVMMTSVAAAFTPDPAMTSFPLTKKRSSYNGYALCVQRILDDHSLYSLDVDGYFGSLTKAEVKKFQLNEGISSDGIVGSSTWSHLWSKLSMWTPQGGSVAYFYIQYRPYYMVDCPIDNNNNYCEWDVLHDNGVKQGIN